MKAFPLTQRRLNSLPYRRKYKWVALWLKDNYIELLNRESTAAGLEHFWTDYRRVQKWLGSEINVQESDKPDTQSQWIEFLAEAFHYHQALSGKGVPEYDFLPEVVKNDRAFEGVWTPSVPYSVALDNIRSAFNVGSIMRVIDATGLEAILMSSKTPGAENRRVHKTAMGTQEWIPCTKFDCLADKLTEEKKSGKIIIGVETVRGASNYHQFYWPAKGIIVLGNEEYGISDRVLRVCDEFVTLPMSGYKNSVNVANAFSVVAFHLQSIFSQQTDAS